MFMQGWPRRLADMMNVSRQYRSWRAHRIVQRLPIVDLRLTADEWDTFTGPGTAFNAAIISANGVEVGHIGFGLSPLGDRLYVHKIDIDPAHQGAGFGTSCLWWLWQRYGHAITPIHIYGSALGFWSKSCRLEPCGLVIAQELRTGHLEAEQRRWKDRPCK